MYKSTFDPAQFSLTEQEAFEAMRCFLEQFYKSAGNDMPTLLADISLTFGNEPWTPHGGTLDPAAWYDWLHCVEQVVARRK
jgi:hypothetical protein